MGWSPQERFGREEFRRRLRVVGIAYVLWATTYEVIGDMARNLNARDLSLPLDHAIPLLPHWVWIYELAYFLPFLGLLVIERPERFNHTVRAILVAALCAYVPYLLYPVSFPRPALGDSLSEQLLAMEYAYDSGGNQLPSLHVANAFLVFLGARGQWLGRWGDGAMLLLAILIALSTLFVKQHLVVDVVGGLALSPLAYRVTRGMRWGLGGAPMESTTQTAPQR